MKNILFDNGYVSQTNILWTILINQYRFLGSISNVIIDDLTQLCVVSMSVICIFKERATFEFITLLVSTALTNNMLYFEWFLLFSDFRN